MLPLLYNTTLPVVNRSSVDRVGKRQWQRRDTLQTVNLKYKRQKARSELITELNLWEFHKQFLRYIWAKHSSNRKQVILRNYKWAKKNFAYFLIPGSKKIPWTIPSGYHIHVYIRETLFVSRRNWFKSNREKIRCMISFELNWIFFF